MYETVPDFTHPGCGLSPRSKNGREQSRPFHFTNPSPLPRRRDARGRGRQRRGSAVLLRKERRKKMLWLDEAAVARAPGLAGHIAAAVYQGSHWEMRVTAADGTTLLVHLSLVAARRIDHNGKSKIGQGHRRHQEPDARHVLQEPRSGFAAVRLGRQSRRAGNRRLRD